MNTATLDPTVKSRINIRLFTNVQNVPELRKKVMSGELLCCLINPKLVLDPLQVKVAANKALVTNNRTTKTVFTEILFNLSISKNITQSLQKFGVMDKCREVLLVTVIENNEDDEEIVNAIKGEEVDIKNLQQFHDLCIIKEVYKIGEIEEKSTSLLDSVVSRIATKDFISH